MATDSDLDAAVRRVLGELLAEGAPYTGLPLVNPSTSLLPDSIVDAIRAPLEDGITDLDEAVGTLTPAVADLEELTTSGRLSEAQQLATIDRGITGSSSLRGLGILRAALALREVSPVAIVQTGSSTPRGTGASTPEKGMFSLLVSALQVAYPSGRGSETAVQASTSADFTKQAVTGIHGYNAAEGSTTSGNYLTNAERDKLIALEPRAIFHQVGSNDFNNGQNPATYKANVQASINYFKANMTAPCVHVLTHPYQRLDTASPVHPWSAYGQALREIAEADPTNVVFLDLSGPYVLAGVPGTDPFNLIGNDNIHLTDAGHALMFDLIRNGLEIGGGGGGATSTVNNIIILTQADPELVGGIYTSDSFSGGDASTLVGRTTDAGVGGTPVALQTSTTDGALIISGGRLMRGTSSVGQFLGLAMNPAFSGQSITATVATKPTSGSSSVLLTVRRTSLSSGNPCYRVAVQSTLILQKVSPSATVTALASDIAYSAGDRVELRAIDNLVDGVAVSTTVTLIVNGAVAAEVVETTVLPAGYAGLSITAASAGFAFDDMAWGLVV